ncbi:hypothetical protein P280DRAFT_130098 [Massarina eburnea CBS 473.64]|uniref:Mid2 domain-containing protein n=1 Tax=Massarina eburnea CBS 473.64 TaxID=1395130 RepID=A0A6A6SGJ9_9PLEO|nr:hypothetical protein P280DRAFT_130098 [Massarina eburnea CBS 473.64]
MGPLAGPRLSRIPLLLLVATILSPVQASSLLLRQSQQCGGVSGLKQCGGDFPSDFCCGENLTCAQVNTTDVKSVICCPKGESCDAIQPVPCDVSLYNATLHPDNQIHISATNDVKLSTCGTQCCPLGYACNSGICTASKQKPLPSSSSPTPSATDPASASQTTGCLAAPVSNSVNFDGKSFAAGFFPGIIIGALGVIGLMWIIKKRRDSDNKRYSGDFGHVARTISDPIYDPMLTNRTDFIRCNTNSFNSTPQKSIGTRVAGGGLTPKIKNMWDHTPKLGVGVWSGLPSTPPPVLRSGERDPFRTPVHTPEGASEKKHSRRRKKSKGKRAAGDTRDGSTETIDVLMPAPSFLEPPKVPDMRENRFTQDSGHTTFTKLMERAGYGDDTRNDVRNLSSGYGYAR